MNLRHPIRLLYTFALAGQRMRFPWSVPPEIGHVLSAPTSLFWLCWSIILVGIALRYPSLAVHAEMFAENGTNLFYHAKHSGFLDNILEFQYYEYLIWFPRLIALLAVKVLALRESYPFVTEWIGHVMTGFFYAFFCLKRFRTILPSDAARFLISAALGIGLLGEYELYAFINFPYHGMFLILILLFSSLDPRPRPEAIGLIVLVFLVCTSKVHPIAFLPLFGVSALLASRMSTPDAPRRFGVAWTPQTALLATASLALLLQAGTTLVVSTVIRPVWTNLATESPAGTLGNAFLYYLKAWLHLLLPKEFLRHESIGLSWLVPGMLLVLSVALGWLCRIHWRRGNRQVVRFFLCCNALAVLNMVVTLTAVLAILKEHEWGKWLLPFQNRWFYLSLTALFLGTVVLVATLFRRHLVQAALTFAMTAFVMGLNRDYIGEYRHYLNRPEDSFSQWELYAHLTEHPDYAIPLNPHPWMLFHETVELGDVDSKNGVYNLETAEPPLVRSAVVMESSSHFQEPYELIACDENGNEIATGRLLTPAGYEHPYYYFEPRVRAARFEFVDEADQPFAGNVTIRFMGLPDGQE